MATEDRPLPQPVATANTTERERDPTFGTRVASTRPGLTENGSFEVVVATETPCGCEVYIPELGGWIWVEEQLDVSGMRQEDIDGFVGCPLLDTHHRWLAEDILGVVDAAWREGTTLLARVRVASTETEILTKLRERIITRVSAGYARRDGATIEMRAGDVPLLTQPFIPREVSLVAIPADPNAHIRTLQALAARTASEEPSMTTTAVIPNLDAIRTAAAALVAALGAAPAAAAAPATDPVDAAAAAAVEGRTAPAAAVVAPAAPAAPVASAVAGARSAADETAIAALRTIATLHGRSAEFEVFVRTGETVEGLRSLARTWSSTNATEVNGAQAGGRAEGQRSLIDFDAAIAAQNKR